MPFPLGSTAHARPCATNVIVAAGPGMLPSHPDGREVMRASTDAGEDGPVDGGFAPSYTMETVHAGKGHR